MQLRDQVGHFGVNHGASGSGDNLNNPKSAPEGRGDSPLRKKTALEGERSFSFPAVPCAKSTSVPKRPSKVMKTINGIRNFFAFIGTNVPDEPLESISPARNDRTSAARSDHISPARNSQQIGGSSRNQGLQLETGMRIYRAVPQTMQLISIGRMCLPVIDFFLQVSVKCLHLIVTATRCASSNWAFSISK